MQLFLLQLVFVLSWSSGFIGAKLGLPYIEPMTFLVTEEFNENYLHAVEDLHSRYMEESADGAPIDAGAKGQVGG